MPTHYEILGVEETASFDDIKKAYRTEAKKYHPDHNKSVNATEKMQKLNAAYEILSSATQRKIYDETLNPSRNANSFMFFNHRQPYQTKLNPDVFREEIINIYKELFEKMSLIQQKLSETTLPIFDSRNPKGIFGPTHIATDLGVIYDSIQKVMTSLEQVRSKTQSNLTTIEIDLEESKNELASMLNDYKDYTNPENIDKNMRYITANDRNALTILYLFLDTQKIMGKMSPNDIFINTNTKRPTN